MKLEHLQSLLRSFVEKGPVGCSLGIHYNGEQVLEEYVGYADLETQREISVDSIFRIYSMTKIVTCTAAMMLYEKGLFLLNDPLEDYLPEFKDPLVHRKSKDGEIHITAATRSIHVKDLFTMTSGITYNGNSDETERAVQQVMNSLGKSEGESTFDVRSVSKKLASIPLAFDPGTQWRYGLSHDVLGALIEVVSGKKFSEFLQEEIFEPLQMRDTFFRLPRDKQSRLCSIYNRNEQGEITKNTEIDKGLHLGSAFESGGAGLFSTLRDYSKFAHMLALGGELDGQRIIGRKTIELMSKNHLNSKQLSYFRWPYLAGYGYGLGVRTMIEPTIGGSNSSIGEFGWSGLAGTWVLIDPKEKLSAVYMQQLLPNLEAYQQPRLRNAIYGAIQ
ncbi:serine hydrolase domain-containing protein [Evansella sp. AB-rgal1]|uniref:serine hydrolase domain-containing protein n=1 Tax=Evansella sp. AB-rgal1 TaxID=3242696 RepID=UPI00359ECBAE